MANRHRKDAQCLFLSGKYKSKPHSDTTSHQSEWLKLTALETTDAGENVENGNPLALLVEMQTGAAIPEDSMDVPQKMKNRTTLRPSNGTTRHLSTGYRCAVLKGHMHPHVYSSIIDNSQSMERAQTSING